MAKCDEARTFANDGKELSNMDTILELLQSYRAREARPTTSNNLTTVMKMESEDDHGSSGTDCLKGFFWNEKVDLTNRHGTLNRILS